jgi:hypothetical protein
MRAIHIQNFYTYPRGSFRVCDFLKFGDMHLDSKF